MNNEHYEKQVYPAREVVSGRRMCDKHKSHLVVVFHQARGVYSFIVRLLLLLLLFLLVV